jgi:hypothetical protein
MLGTVNPYKLHGWCRSCHKVTVFDELPMGYLRCQCGDVPERLKVVYEVPKEKE